VPRKRIVDAVGDVAMREKILAGAVASVGRHASDASDWDGPGEPEKELRRGQRARENEPDSKGSGDGRSDKPTPRAETLLDGASR
jgi:hypothetical protein